MATFPVTGLGVEMRETADGQMYQFGVTVDGVFIAFGGRKTGGVNDDLARAAEAKAQAAAAQPAPQPTEVVGTAPVAPVQ